MNKVLVSKNIKNFIEKYDKDKTYSLTELSISNNSRVYLINYLSGKKIILKEYDRSETDKRDRGYTEFSSLTFLKKNNVLSVPSPIALSFDHKIGLYEYKDGRKITSADISEKYLDEMLNFIDIIQTLRNKPGAEGILPASEACFSIKEYFISVRSRLSKLKEGLKNKGTDGKCRVFLEKEFSLFYEDVLRNIESGKPDKKITKEDRILSPSDFGFHNMFILRNRKLCFFDFEYFGWDDPVKLANDFILQPRYAFPDIYREKIYKRFMSYARNSEDYSQRFPIGYIAFGLKWCLIFLNVFLKDKHDNGLKEKQLEKSVNLLANLQEEWKKKKFPLSLL